MTALPGHADNRPRQGGGFGGGARSSPSEEDVPLGVGDFQEGTSRPRWVAPGGTQDIYHPWASTGPSGAGGAGRQAPMGDMPDQWPQSGQGRAQAPATADNGHLLGLRDRGTPPSASLGGKPNTAQGQAASSGAFERHQMTNHESEEETVSEPDMEKRIAPCPAGPGPVVRNTWLQPDLRPDDLCVVRTVSGDLVNSPLGSAYFNNPGSSQLQRIDNAAAAASGNLPHPSGNPDVRPQFHSAPIGKSATSEIGRRG